MITFILEVFIFKNMQLSSKGLNIRSYDDLMVQIQGKVIKSLSSMGEETHGLVF